MAEPDALRAFADAMLAPLDAYDRGHGGELAASLQAFLQHNARWETAAGELYVHRHTLRYRMRKVEELTGRDLASSFDRMEFWLALRARDLLRRAAARRRGGPLSSGVQRAGSALGPVRRVVRSRSFAAYWRARRAVHAWAKRPLRASRGGETMA